MGEQGLDRLVYGKTGNVLGHEVLTYRPVDEAAQGLPGVEVGVAEGRRDVIECEFSSASPSRAPPVGMSSGHVPTPETG